MTFDRNDTGATLGHVGGTAGGEDGESTGYSLINHAELGEIMESLLDLTNPMR